MSNRIKFTDEGGVPFATLNGYRTTLTFVATKFGSTYASTRLSIGATRNTGEFWYNRVTHTATFRPGSGFELEINGEVVPAATLHYTCSGNPRPEWTFLRMDACTDATAVPPRSPNPADPTPPAFPKGSGAVKPTAPVPKPAKAAIPQPAPALKSVPKPTAAASKAAIPTTPVPVTPTVPKGSGLQINVTKDNHRVPTATTTISGQLASHGLARFLNALPIGASHVLSLGGKPALSGSKYGDTTEQYCVIRPLEGNALLCDGTPTPAIRIRLNGNRATELVAFDPDAKSEPEGA